MKILPCTGNRPLGKAIAARLKAPLVQASIQRFADQEISVDITESVHGQDIFVIQPTSCPTNDRLMELLITIDTLKRGAARSITAVIPYYGYGRQDRKTSLNNSLSAKLVANLLTVAGTNHIITVDWHSNSIQGFFDIPANNLSLASLFCQEIQKRHKKKPVVIVSPDIGGLSRARNVANHLSADLAIVDKRRSQQGKVTVVNLMGTVAGQNCVLIDDIVDSGKTLCQAADALMAAGALCVSAYVSHGVLSGNALENLATSSLQHLVISDTIHLPPTVHHNPKVSIVPVANLLADAMSCIAHDQPLSGLLHVAEANK